MSVEALQNKEIQKRRKLPRTDIKRGEARRRQIFPFSQRSIRKEIPAKRTLFS